MLKNVDNPQMTANIATINLSNHKNARNMSMPDAFSSVAIVLRF
jgi:hypothetical protein